MSAAVPPADPPPARRRRVPGAERRGLILGAARGAFARRGFDGASTAAIAADAGCAEAVLYRHFPSKHALLVAVLRREIALRVDANRALAPPGEGRPTPQRMPAQLRARLADDEMTTTLRLLMLAVARADDPPVAEALADLFAVVRAPLRAHLVAARANGSLAPGVDPDDAAWMWHGLMLAALMRRAIADDGVADEGVRAARALAALLGPPEGGPAGQDR